MFNQRKVRIELNDSMDSIFAKMSENNPGALGVLVSMLTHNAKIDPDDLLGGFGSILFLDTLGIYGPRIWVFYKDVCGQNIVKTVGLLRAVQLGFCQDEELNHAIDNRGEGIDIPALLAQVRERLPAFIKEDVLNKEPV